jgi:hypothetical protein
LRARPSLACASERVLGFVALLAAGSLLAVAPALIAVRTSPATALRAE